MVVSVNMKSQWRVPDAHSPGVMAVAQRRAIRGEELLEHVHGLRYD
jgi:hypothetical protein